MSPKYYHRAVMVSSVPRVTGLHLRSVQASESLARHPSGSGTTRAGSPPRVRVLDTTRQAARGRGQGADQLRTMMTETVSVAVAPHASLTVSAKVAVSNGAASAGATKLANTLLVLFRATGVPPICAQA